MSPVYLDYAATSPLLPEVQAAMFDAMQKGYGNASALHSAGQSAKSAIEEARAQVAQLINADPAEIIFTSGGSEANNIVAETFRGQKIAASSIEHPSVLEAMRVRAGEFRAIPVDEFGFVNPGDIPQDANLVSIMLANNELGSLTFLASDEHKRVSTRAAMRERPVWTGVGVGLSKAQGVSRPCIHSDAVQALGKIHIDVKQLGVDYLTLSAHKIGGPLGVGALYVKHGAPLTPLIIGGHQENNRRAGTSNTIGIIGFGAAAKHAWDNWTCKLYAAQVQPLRDQLRARILQEIPHSSCNSPTTNCLPNILNMSFAAAEGESIQLYLDLAGIMVSTGSACAAGDTKPSHVLMATKHDAEVAHSSIRFSLGLETTQTDIDRVMQVLPGIIKQLQSISTVKLEK